MHSYVICNPEGYTRIGVCVYPTSEYQTKSMTDWNFPQALWMQFI